MIIKLKVKGFTLIELMVTVGVFAVTGTVILAILSSTLRVSKKADTLLMVKQSGNFAITKMVNQIRYAKSLDSPVSCTPEGVPGDIAITSNQDNKQTTFHCGVDTLVAITETDSEPVSLVPNSVNVKSCTLTCFQKGRHDPPTINIKFTLESKNSGLVENSNSIPFQTSVTMRNHNE